MKEKIYEILLVVLSLQLHFILVYVLVASNEKFCIYLKKQKNLHTHPQDFIYFFFHVSIFLLYFYSSCFEPQSLVLSKNSLAHSCANKSQKNRYYPFFLSTIYLSLVQQPIIVQFFFLD